MKKLFLIAALLIPLSSFAGPREHHHEGGHHEWHERYGSGNGWAFFGGLILGGIIAHEVDGHYYDQDDYEVRRITVCKDVPLYTRYGDVYGYERQCHEEWVRVNY
jgi:hypothetical protein